MYGVREHCNKCETKRKQPHYYNNIDTYKKRAFNHYNQEFYDGQRDEVLARDNYTCQHCGITDKEHIEKYGYSLAIHHKDGNGTTVPKEQRNNNIDNLETLCCSCHKKLHPKHKNIKIEMSSTKR